MFREKRCASLFAFFKAVSTADPRDLDANGGLLEAKLDRRVE